jgi:AcrR family transcriptional regulator
VHGGTAVVSSGARTGAGDPARTLALLWRRPADGTGTEQGTGPRRGPKRGLSVDEVIRAAIALADAEGLDALTMRRLAQELGAAPMTLYTYVPTKAELLDLMLDSLYEELVSGLPEAPAAPPAPGWRARVEAIALSNRALFQRHPWAASVSTVRPPLGPGQMAKYERELRAFDGLGLDDVELDDALTFLLGFVRASALADAETAAAARESRMSDAQWWEANAPLLSRVLDSAAFPTAARVGSAAGAAHGASFNPEHAFHFGLERVLDGLEALVARTTATPDAS